MGRRLRLDGEPVEYEEDTPIRRLKRDAGWAPDDVVIYVDEKDENHTVSDIDQVGDVPEGAPVSRQAAEGRVFG